MALQRAVYRPRDAEHTVLHQVIAEHLEVFLRRPATAPACRSSSRASSGSSWRAAYSNTAWRGFGARAAGASTWYRSRV